MVEFIKLAPLVRKIRWSKNVFIIEKCKDDLQRKLDFTFGRVDRKLGFVMICASEGQVLYQGKERA